MGPRVLLAMSGGVDSSVAAWLLREQGYEVVGLFMRTGAAAPEPVGAACAPTGRTTTTDDPPLPVLDVHASGRHRGCCSAVDADDARRVADRLDIPFYALDFEGDFTRIKDYFVDEYRSGRTPNPCVMCNNWLKFGRLWEYAQQIGADHVATGHYARIAWPPDASGPQLMRAVDSAKDQSYVLFGLSRVVLPRLLFPIGHLAKAQVRDIARRLQLRVADKPDSQEICFVPNGDHFAFIRARSPERDTSGEIVDTERGVVGRHDGIEQFTVGQRKGLGVALGARRYVLQIDAAQRRVVVGPRERLLGRGLVAESVNWLCEPPTDPLDCSVKIRYLHEPAAARVIPVAASVVRVAFAEPQSAITPGQAAVFYAGERVLGGGIIARAVESDAT
jgi:tRNA-specific 2-thiouridylase